MNDFDDIDREAQKRALLNLSGEGSVIPQTEEYQLPSKTESTLWGAQQGATLGWGDEASAALGAAFPSETDKEMNRSYRERYKQIKDYLNKDISEAKQANPKTFLGGQIAGGLSTAAATPALSGTKLLTNVPAAATTLAGYGAVQGAGEAEEGKRLEGAYESGKEALKMPYKLAKGSVEALSQGEMGSAVKQAALLIPLAVALKSPKLSELAKKAEKNGRSFVTISTKEVMKDPELINLVERGADDIYHVTSKGNLKGIQESGKIYPRVGQVRKSTYGMEDDIEIPEMVFMGEEPGLPYGEWKKTQKGEHLSGVKDIPELEKRLNNIAVARIKRDPEFVQKVGDEDLQQLSGSKAFREDYPDYTMERGDIVSTEPVRPKEIVTGKDTLPYLEKDSSLYKNLKERFPKLDQMIAEYKSKSGWKEKPISLNSVDEYDFLSSMKKASKDQPKIKEFTTDYKPEEIKDFQKYISPDERSGFMIKPDGEITALFSANKGRGDALVKEAIAKGGTKLDAFEGYLPKLYEKHGFKEYKREPNWNKGGPDVVYMALPNKHPELFKK